MSLMRSLMLLPAAVFVGGLAFLASNATANMPPAPYTNPPRTLVIGIDLSSSNPLIRDSAFAQRVAERIKPLISGLAPHSRIIFRSFGAYNSSANSPLTIDITIAPKTARAEDMANLISSVIAGVPRMVQQGRLQPQHATNIVPFLLNMAKIVDCRAMPTHVILASDGVEDSQVANLTRRNATLPAPPSAPFPGCEDLQILGIGRGLNSPSDTERLRGEWHYWSQAAGFKGFIGLNDW
ncbi:MAG: hypothetical protein SGJ03_10700 [Alphaproteobacteria bacterium]|nr:hypothetical protein [Alphaproteobacteria bacterium]